MTEKELNEIERQREEAVMTTSPTQMAIIGYAYVPRLIAEIRRLHAIHEAPPSSPTKPLPL